MRMFAFKHMTGNGYPLVITHTEDITLPELWGHQATGTLAGDEAQSNGCIENLRQDRCPDRSLLVWLWLKLGVPHKP